VDHFPLIFVTGPGAGARNSIGVILVSGMIIGTLFKLFVLPSIYYFLGKDCGKQEENPITNTDSEERKFGPMLAQSEMDTVD